MIIISTRYVTKHETTHNNTHTIYDNIQQNIYVPQHICIKDIIEIEKILKKCNCKLNQLPIINKSDIICRLKQLCPGDICKIIRSSKKTGDYEYYRLCK